MTYPNSSAVVPGQATEAAQYNNLRMDALYLGADPESSGTVRDLLFSAAAAYTLTAEGKTVIRMAASAAAPVGLMIGGQICAISADQVLTLSSDTTPDAGRYVIYAIAQSDGSFILALTASGTYRAVGQFCWDGSGIIPGTVRTSADAAMMAVSRQPSSAAGRLSLVAGDPIPDADIDQADLLYFVPYNGDEIGLYIAGAWEYFSFSALSLGTSGMVSGLPYDIFLSADSDGLALRAVAWPSNSGRTAGSLQWVDGVRVSGANSGMRFVGTVALNESGKYEDSRTARLVWNENNRTSRPILAKLNSSKTAGTSRMNCWVPYYDEDAPAVQLVISGADVEFELMGVGISSPISESDRSYQRFATIGVLIDPVWETPYTGNESCVPIFTHSYGNSPMVVSVINYDSRFQGVHELVLGFYSNYNFSVHGNNFSASTGGYPGLYGKIEA